MLVHLGKCHVFSLLLNDLFIYLTACVAASRASLVIRAAFFMYSASFSTGTDRYGIGIDYRGTCTGTYFVICTFVFVGTLEYRHNASHKCTHSALHRSGIHQASHQGSQCRLVTCSYM